VRGPEATRIEQDAAVTYQSTRDLFGFVFHFLNLIGWLLVTLMIIIIIIIVVTTMNDGMDRYRSWAVAARCDVARRYARSTLRAPIL
jgi:uncharacterized membrane protein